MLSYPKPLLHEVSSHSHNTRVVSCRVNTGVRVRSMTETVN